MAAVTAPPRLIALKDVPSLAQEELLSLHERHLNESLVALMRLGGYHGIRPVRAEGAWIETADGRRILDLVSSYGALSHGHNHPRLVEAARWIDAQAPADLLKEFPSPWTAALGRNLAELAPDGLETVLFGNSGTEAVEAALKLAVRWSGGRRTRFVYAEDSLHGKTFGSLQVTGREKYRTHVPRFDGWPMVPFGDTEAVADAFRAPEGDRIAGVILEPIQGEGGVVVPPPGYLKAVEDLCRAHGALLILDEVQTAIGRTGTMFRCEAEGVTPDILCIAKSLGGGVATIGAAITRPEIYKFAYGRIDDCLVHTSTFGGRARACGVAIEALQVAVDEDFSGRAREIGGWLRGELEKVRERHPESIRAIRGEGLMLGVELETPKIKVPPLLPRAAIKKIVTKYLPGIVGAELLHRHGILASFVLNNPRVLRVYPPLVATREDLARVPEALESVLEKGVGKLARGMVERTVKNEGLRAVLSWIRRW